MNKLNKGDTIGLISCSNGLNLNMKEKLDKLIQLLKTFDINVILSNSIYKNVDGITLDAKIRATELMNLYRNKNIKFIFDVSGGDLCNEVLDYLDFNEIKASNKIFVGYSDLTVLLNSIYSKTGLKSINYQIRNLINKDSKLQLEYFINNFLKEEDLMKNINYKYIKGSTMNGIVIGGNIRCFLKLAGTEYMPSFNNKILFLESLSGDVNKISTFLAQYKQIGAFNKINGLILGTFTELEEKYSNKDIELLFLDKLKDYKFPIVKTSELGHNSNSKAILIGEHISI